MKRAVFWGVVFAFVFGVLAMVTLGDYGTSWDETLHYRRGHAYLHYYLTGKRTYDDLEGVDLQGTGGEPDRVAKPRRSFYQVDKHDMEEILKIDGAHGPLSDQLAALSNYIFYQKLGVLDDISAHHVYIVLASSVLVLVVVSFGVEVLGVWGGVVAGLALVTYPLFWAESHFNIKDPVQAAYFSGVIWSFWKAFEKKSAGWLWVGFGFLTLALGTKLNAVFLPAILVPYWIWRCRKDWGGMGRRFWVSLFLGPLVVGIVLFATWPFLWHDTLGGIGKILGYYKSMGTGFDYQPDGYYWLGFNLFPVVWILLTTPPLVLALSGVGVWGAIRERRTKPEGLLWLVWFLVPVVRVTMPGTSIYGGVRQIFEFIPAMALLAGMGAWEIYRLFFEERRKWMMLLVVSFVWPAMTLAKYHPYENVYFNFLIGGLSGAREYEIPSWGNSYGSAYREGIEWLNENAEENSKLALIQGAPPNAPNVWLRGDIDFGNENWSGINREGEYLMELTFNDTGKSYYYAWEYVEKFLVPVYELKVDGVAILVIWKNDWEHTKEEWRVGERELEKDFSVELGAKGIEVNLGGEEVLSRLFLEYESDNECCLISNSFVETSIDGERWAREKDWIVFPQVFGKDNLKDDKISFYLAGREARYVRFVLDNEESCALSEPSLRVVVLERNAKGN